MELINLVGKAKNIKLAKEMANNELPGEEFDLIDVYMIDSIDMKSDIKLFNAEETPYEKEIEIDGIKYVNLFPLSMLQEMIEDYSKLPEMYSDSEIAERILRYRLYDA